MVDTRKNFRFPAFDENVGVKLPEGSERVLFADDFPYAEAPQTTATQDEDQIEATVTAAAAEGLRQSVPEMPKAPERSLYEPKKPAPLKRPDYSLNVPTNTKKEDNLLPRKLFNSEHRPSFESKFGQDAIVPVETKTSPAQTNKYNGRNYFVPKHIPPSIIAKEADATLSSNEMVARMRKEKSSYLVLAAEEERPFQQTEISKKEIITFDTSEEAQAPFFQGRELRSEKEEPALLQKQGAKNSRLEKTLGGIIAEEDSHSHGNKYFD